MMTHTPRHLLRSGLFAIALCLAGTLSLCAMPALTRPQIVKQPDGKSLTVRQHGDEWFHWTATDDGYAVVRDTDGWWRYAPTAGNPAPKVCPVAADAADRDAASLSFLSGQPRGIPPRAAQEPSRSQFNHVDQSLFRGLIILVEYNDRQFISEDPATLYRDMVSQEHFQGYTNDVTGQWVPCTGSVRDYYRDNSMGQFDPEFDIVGPVTVNYSQSAVEQTTHAREIFAAALRQADPLVDYSRYDGDGDGVVDMVFFMVAGGGAHAIAGSPFLWPHAWTLPGVTLDGVTFYNYACSTELFGAESQSIIDGIGPMCHEFAHVLGLADHYDTNYSTNGSNNHPDTWDIMAAGGHLNQSRTPAGMSAYERYALGWLTPTPAHDTARRTLRPLQEHNEAWRIDSAVPNEFFLLENRQQTSWDAYLPGHGMLVWHVDSTDAGVWENNLVNASSSHGYLTLVRAHAVEQGAHDCDPFPGTHHVTALTNATTFPSIRAWSGEPTPWVVTGIAERDGLVTFNTVEPANVRLTETFEDIRDDGGALRGVLGLIAFSKGMLVSHDGGHAAGLLRGGMIELDIDCEMSLDTVCAIITNPLSGTALLRLSYSSDGGETYTNIPTDDGSTFLRLEAGSVTTASYVLASTLPGKLRFSLPSGSANDYVLIDDITIAGEGSYSALPLSCDINGDGTVDIADVNIAINAMLGKAMSDEWRATSDVNSDGMVDIADINAIINAMLAK